MILANSIIQQSLHMNFMTRNHPGELKRATFGESKKWMKRAITVTRRTRIRGGNNDLKLFSSGNWKHVNLAKLAQ